jgi:hypothetical protein
VLATPVNDGAANTKSSAFFRGAAAGFERSSIALFSRDSRAPSALSSRAASSRSVWPARPDAPGGDCRPARARVDGDDHHDGWKRPLLSHYEQGSDDGSGATCTCGRTKASSETRLSRNRHGIPDRGCSFALEA